MSEAEERAPEQTPAEGRSGPGDLRREIRYLKEHARIPTREVLRSRRPVLGRLLVLLRRGIRRAIRFYAEPMAEDQSARNERTAAVLEGLEAELRALRAQAGLPAGGAPRRAAPEDPEAHTGRDIFRDNQLRAVEVSAGPDTALEPAFPAPDVTVLTVASDSFAVYAGVLLHSIVENASPERTYDLVVLETDMTVRHMNELTDLAAGRAHISVRFVNVAALVDPAALQVSGTNYNYYTYYRLLAPHLMRKYPKVLYLDADTLANADVAELYDFDVTGAALAGTCDITVASWQSHPGELREYFRSLGLREPGTYVQAGVLLLNIGELNRRFTPDFLLKKACERAYLLNDQDLINVFCKDQIRFFGVEWNVFVLSETARLENERYLPDRLYEAYTLARRAPKLIHYTEKQFPDRVPDGDMAELYWKYARNTPFYERLR